MTEYGLEHIPESYVIERERLLTESAAVDWRQHTAEKIWVQDEDRAARVAGDYDFHMITEIAQRFYALQASTREPD